QGWLRSFGTFGSRYVVLEIGTHDLFQPMAPSSLVDSHPSFPSRRPKFAWEEMVARYLMPGLAHRVAIRDPGTDNNRPDLTVAQGSILRLLEMTDFARTHGATPIVLHVEQPASREPIDQVTLRAKAMLIADLAARGIALISAAEALNASGGEHLFRDDFHP